MSHRGLSAVEIVLSGEDREVLALWARRAKSAQALAMRAEPEKPLREAWPAPA
jgi:hypothetical protein